MKFDFLFQSSPWFILLCLLAGAIYAFVLYQISPTPWNKSTNRLLAAFRFIGVSLICLLLLNFLIRQITQSVQKRTLVLAIDNSQSMGIANKQILSGVLSQLESLKEKLQEEDFEISWTTLDGQNPEKATDIQFNQKSTNLSSLLSGIKNAQEGNNLSDVVLLTDGIVNEGINPSSEKFTFAVHTVGLGDTIPKKDIAVKSIYANKIAYLGNKFPIQADISSYGFQGKTVSVYLKQGGKTLEKQVINFQQKDDLKTVSFNTLASQKGVQHFVVQVDVLGGEFSSKNNQQDVYVEVIDGKEKVLLMALSPHPDIKAIKSMLDKNENFEIDVKILTENPFPDLSNKNYDVLILHQLPDYFNSYSNIYKPLLDKGIPTLFVLGNQTGTTYLNQLNQVMRINSQAGQTDKVTGYYNGNFKSLNFEAESLDLIKQFPQVSVPFGDITLLPNSEVILYQKIGSLQTQKPLFAINTGPKKSAIFAGEGIWTWRLEEFDLTEKQELIDDIFLKVVQFLSAKDDKRKLRVYPISNEFLLSDKVVFETEIYNGIYEKMYNIPVALELKDEKGRVRKYNYTPSADNSKFEISALPAGVYQYKANASVLGKNEQSTGEFIVKDLQIELSNTTADFDLLRQLSAQTGGKFLPASQLAQLEKQILAHKAPEKIESNEDLKEFINLKWVFFLIIALFTTEWVLRKYMGGY
ncbi:vWA domain-containing protein [Cellulophaga sp. BC115SP]|uniref:vWA domain-containing protein n=1 Tax=Cellulophaga sp. BC115SP TaxID=2683263 RepID=UPI001411D511|nr:vWA domain-containing protein [Cellulophaga sp. BC115SP]NBB26698.1 VWA domain-containing protein [Cellulophaga sp. BC115SP]